MPPGLLFGITPIGFSLAFIASQAVSYGGSNEGQGDLGMLNDYDGQREC